VSPIKIGIGTLGQPAFPQANPAMQVAQAEEVEASGEWRVASDE
jgi:hypothetical protein